MIEDSLQCTARAAVIIAPKSLPADVDLADMASVALDLVAQAVVALDMVELEKIRRKG